jgi:hypothetical protein
MHLTLQEKDYKKELFSVYCFKHFELLLPYNYSKMKTILCTLLLLTGLNSYGQQYKTAIGFKGGYPGYGALSIKHFLGSSTAFEGNLGGGKNHLWVQGLFEKNNPFKDNFEWYWGIGADFLSYNKGHHYYYKNEYYGFNLGAVGLVGIEYTFEEIPINLAFDCGPRVNLMPYFGVGFGGNFAIRFAIQ